MCICASNGLSLCQVRMVLFIGRLFIETLKLMVCVQCMHTSDRNTSHGLVAEGNRKLLNDRPPSSPKHSKVDRYRSVSRFVDSCPMSRYSIAL